MLFVGLVDNVDDDLETIVEITDSSEVDTSRRCLLKASMWLLYPVVSSLALFFSSVNAVFVMFATAPSASSVMARAAMIAILSDDAAFDNAAMPEDLPFLWKPSFEESLAAILILLDVAGGKLDVLVLE